MTKKHRPTAKALPSVEFLKERFDYNADTGVILRRHYHGMRPPDVIRYAGKPAGYVATNGYIQIGIGSRLVYAHRVAFKMHTGKEPPAEIDHKDGDTTNNRFSEFTAGRAC